LCAGFGMVVALRWALLTPPVFYQRADQAVRASADRPDRAEAFMQKAVRLANDVQHQPHWSIQFTETEINSWLAEELPRQYSELLPSNVSEPRVALDDGTLHIGVRLEDSPGREVLSLSVRPQVLTDHRLALQIESVQVGRLPIPLDRVLEDMRRSGITERWRVSWYVQDGRDVAVINLSELVAPSITLDAIEIKNDRLTITGTGKASRTSRKPNSSQ